MDFDLHGLVGIRCVDAPSRELAVVGRQLGLESTPLSREPDLRIRFVERFEKWEGLQSLGADEVAFGDDAFYVLRGPRRSRVRVRVPLEEIGGPCEIVCERGLVGVPLLPELIHLTALARGVLPLHAAAFEHEGRGVVVTGWSGGGKTATLLAFMTRGARYVGDDRVYLEAASGRIFGVPEPICVREWQLGQLPGYANRLGRGRRLALRLTRIAADGVDRAIEARRARGRPPARLLDRLLPALRGRLDVEWPARALFGAQALALSGTLDRVLVAATHSSPEVVVEPMAAGEAVERIAVLLEHERRALTSAYSMFRFAFPERRNPLVESAGQRERALLARALEGAEIYSLRHPHPVALAALFDAVRTRL